MDNEIKQLNVKLTLEEMNMLEELVSITNTNKSAVVIGLIKGEYDKLHGNPKLKAILEQMKVMQIQIDDFIPNIK